MSEGDFGYAKDLLELCYAGKHNELHNHLSQFSQLVHTVYSEDRLSLLHISADIGNLNVVKILVESGAQINLVTTSGHSPLYFAARNGHKEVVRYLLSKGANPFDYVIQTSNFSHDIAYLLHQARENRAPTAHAQDTMPQHKVFPVPLKIDEFKAQKQVSSGEMQNRVAVKLKALVDVRLLGNPERFGSITELFRNFERGSRSDHYEDIAQLNRLVLEWLMRINTEKQYDEALVAAWFYLKLRAYDDGARAGNFVELEKVFLPFMITAIASDLLHCNTVEQCGQLNPVLLAHLTACLDAFFNVISAKPHSQEPLELRHIVYILGLLKTYCDLRVVPQQAALWVSRMSVKANVPIEQVVQEMTATSFMMTGLKSVPEKRMPALFFAILNGLKHPAEPVMVLYAASLFPLSFLKQQEITTLANDHIARLVKHLPGPPFQYLRIWLDVTLSIYTSIENRAPELLALLIYPVLHCILFMPPDHDSLFRELVVLREPTHSYDKEWNTAVHATIASLLRADVKLPSQLSRIPPELMQTKEIQLELASFCSRFVEHAPNKIFALHSVAQILDLFCSNGLTTVDLFIPLSTLSKACTNDKKDVGALVAAFISMAFFCGAFGEMFDANNEAQLQAAKELLSNDLCKATSIWRIDKLENHLYEIEVKFSNRTKFPPLYTLLVKAMGDLTVESLLNELNKDSIQGFPEVCALLTRLLPPQKGTQLISSFKLRIFLKAISFALLAFDSLKYDFPRETALALGLGYSNHGPKNKLEKDQEACPYCTAYVPLANLEEHFNIHVSKQGVSSPVLGELWKSYTSGVDKLKSQFQNHLHSLVGANYTQREAEKLVGCAPAYRALALVCGIKLSQLPDPQQIMAGFKKAVAEVNELQLVSKWLRVHNIQVFVTELPPENQLVTMSLKDINARINTYIRNLNIDPEVLTLLKFFLRMKSVLFDAITKQFTAKFTELSLDEVAPIVANAKNFMEKLLDSDKLKLTDLKEVHELMRQFRNTFTTELAIAADFFKTHMPNCKQQDVDRITDLLKTGFELLQFHEDLPQLINCLQHYKICEGDVVGLQAYYTALKVDLGNIALSQVSNWLARLLNLIPEIKSNYMKYFYFVHQGAEVVEFLRNMKDFQQQADLLGGQLQGYQFGMSMLNSVFVVRDLVQPFLNYNLKDKHSLKSFCESVGEKLGKIYNQENPEELAKRLDNIMSVLEHLAEVRMWFSQKEGLTLDTILPFVSRLWKYGHYNSKTGKDAGIYLLFAENAKGLVEQGTASVERELPQGTIQDLVRGMTIFISKTGIEQAKLQEIQDFVNAYKLAQEIHGLHAQLENAAHPDFQRQDLRIPRQGEGTMTIGAFEKRKEDLKNQLQQWTKSLQEVYEEFPRLLFLNRKQLPNLLSKLATLKNSGRAATKLSQASFALVSPILALIPMCFPEFHERQEITQEMIIEHCWKVLHDYNPQPGVQDSMEYLKVAAHIIQQLQDTITNLNIESIIDVRPSPPVILIAHNIDESSLFRLLIDLNEGAPHPVTTMQCSNAVTVADLECFLGRVEKFVFIRYFMVGVNKLHTSVQEALLKWVSTLFLEKRQNEVGHLHLIYGERVGVEVFSFLKCEKVENIASLETTLLYIKQDALLKKRKLDIFECLGGYPCSGKTFYIKKTLKNMHVDHRLFISMAEDFTVQTFVDKIRQILKKVDKPNQQRVLGVHFNISAYAPFEIVSRFFYNFIFFGLLWDESTGEMEYIQDNIHWIIYVELGQAPENDPLFLRSSVELVSNALPAIKYTAKFTTQFLQAPLEIDLDVMLCLSYLNLFTSKTGPVSHAYVSLQAKKSAIMESEEDIRAAYAQVENLVDQVLVKYNVHLPKLHLFRSMFFHLLADRCKWLRAYCAYIVRLTDEMMKEGLQLEKGLDPKILFELFLREAGKICEDSMRKDLIKNSPVFSSRAAGEVPYVNFMNFGVEDPLGLPVLTKQEAMNNSALLRNFLGPALGLTNTHRMYNLVLQQKYVLTPDFAAKMLVIHERLKSGHAVILSGDTGVGKTELFSLYSVIINSDSSYVPDILSMFYDFVMDTLIYLPATDSRPRMLRTPDFAKYTKVVDKKPVVSREDMNSLKKVVLDLCDEEIPEEQLFVENEKDTMEDKLQKALFRLDMSAKNLFKLMPEKPETPEKEKPVHEKEPHENRKIPFSGLVAHLVVSFISHTLRQFPVIEQTPVLQHVVAYNQPAEYLLQKDFAKDQEPEGGTDVSIRTVEELSQLLNDFLSAKFHDLFYRIMMHHKMSSYQFKQRTLEMIRNTNRLRAGHASASQIKVICFVDEFNATSIMGMLKEVFVDHTIDGEEIPPNVLWVAAMNPFDSLKTFIVRPHPPSMDQLVIDFGTFKHDQEEPFISVLLHMRYDSRDSSENAARLLGKERKSLLKFVLFSQNFVREAKMDRISLSIRDIMRTLNVYHFLRFTTAGREVMRIMPSREEHIKMFVHAGQQKEKQFSADIATRYFQLYTHWQTLIVAIAMGYYFRLPSRGEKLIVTSGGKPVDEKYDRISFAENIDRMLRESGCPDDLKFHSTLQGLLNSFYANTQIPIGIARTDSLTENLFCVVMCIEIKIPILVVGPPGCAKTLSFSIAVENMKGKQSPKPLYKNFHNIHPFRYQCSEQSTDLEVESIYSSAIDRQGVFQQHDPLESGARSTVFIDEAGLPKELEMPLKVLHYHFDHPKVSSVVLSNDILDAAKTNRTMQLLQSAISKNDLKALANGCIFELKQAEGLNSHLLVALCDSYLECNKFAERTKQHLFHLRDFVYLLRYLRKRCFSDGQFVLKASDLLRGLQRNFNGIEASDFEGLVKLFFANVNRKLSAHGEQEWKIPTNLETDTFIELIQDSLSETLGKGENPNTSPTRYIMLIDPTDNETAVGLLFSHNLCDIATTEICYVGDFSDDANDLVRSESVLKVKTAMELGQTVILVNSGPIHSCFYDVFNRHFTLLSVGLEPGDASLAGKNVAGEHRFQCFANLAVGSYSRPCIVHEKFKLIVHIPASALPKTPLALLNRFEKYRVSVEQALSNKMRQIDWEPVRVANGRQVRNVPILDIIRAGCEDMVQKFHGPQSQSEGRLLYGVVPYETVASFVLWIAERSLTLGKNSPEFPPKFTIYKKGKHAPKETEGTEQVENADPIEKDEQKEPENIEPIPEGEGPSTEDAAEDYYMEEEEEEFEDPNSNKHNANAHQPPSNRLQEFIRLANFHILQLARPEYIFFCRNLPSAYITEYLLHQEHLSFVRFFHHTLNNFFRPNGSINGPTGPNNSTNKWCVFMRTSGELLRLHTDADLQELLVSPLVELDEALEKQDEKFSMDKPERYSTFADKRLKVISLQNITTTTACERTVSRLVNSRSQRIIICVADMRVCTQSQVNVFRNRVDRSCTKENASRYLFIVVLHFPPEMGPSSKPCYHAVFVKNWDFMYIDSLGVTTGGPESDDDENKEHAVIEADPRTWIAKGFGLPINISASSVATTFSDLFFQILRQCCSGMAVIPLQPRYIKYTKRFYLMPQGRFEILEAVYRALPFLNKDIFAKLGELWSSSFLNHMITNECKKIQMGQVVGSLLHSVSSSLRVLVAPLVHQITKMLCSNYSLEPIAAINAPAAELKAPKKDLCELIRSVISTVELPPLSDIFKHPVYTTIALSNQFTFPPHLPLFDIISNKLLKLSASATQKLTITNVVHTPDNFCNLLAELIKQDPVARIVAFIDEHTALLRLFKEDFVKRTLRMHSMTSVWLDVCVSILDGLCLSRGRIDICHLYVIKKFDDEKISYLNICLRPLLTLLDPERPKLPNKDTMADTLQNTANINKLILAATVKTLWNRFETVKKNAEDEAMAENWCHVFRSLRSRLKNRRDLVESLPLTLLIHFDLQMCVFLFALNFSLSPVQLFGILGLAEVKNVWAAVLEKAYAEENTGIERHTYRGLPNLLPLVAVLWKVRKAQEVLAEEAQEEEIEDEAERVELDDDEEEDQEEEIKEKRETVESKGVHFVQDIMSYFLSDKGTKSEFTNKELEYSMAAITCFFSACMGKCDLYGLEEPWNELWSNVPKTWIIWTVKRIFHGKTPERSSYILDEATKLISASYQQGYSYIPNLLNSAENSNLLEDAIFYVRLENCESQYAATSLEGLCQLYQDIPTKDLTGYPLVTHTLNRVALSAFILQKVAVQLRDPKFDTLIAQWDENATECVKTLLGENEVTEEGKNDGNDLRHFLLNQIYPSQQLVKVLRSRETLEKLGLANYFVAENISVQNYYLFSFMVDSSTALGKQYAHFAALMHNADTGVILTFLQESIGGKQDEQEKICARNLYRMFILLVSYYEYFNLKKPCTPILYLLQRPDFITLMDINADELGMYKMIANLPPHTHDKEGNLDPLQHLFSLEAREDNTDLSIAHIMVNSMAVCVGSPRDSNHVYNRAFDLKKLERSKGPGSDFHHENWDCGYQLLNGTLMNADIMGNHTGFRLALNTLIWASFSWCVLVDEEKGCAACLDFKHFLNYWQTDGRVVYSRDGVARNRTDNQKIKYYIVTRAQSFFMHLCQDPEMNAKHIDGVHFLTESLFKLWQLIYNDQKPSERDVALRGLYKNPAEAKAYEDIFKEKIFDVVTEDYINLKNVYQHAAQSNEKIKTITSVQNTQSMRLVSPLVSFEVFREFFANYQTRKKKASQKQAVKAPEPEETTEEEKEEPGEPEENQKLLPYFLEERVKLKALVHLPTLVSFYKLLRETFAYKLTQEQANSMTVPQCIELLQNDGAQSVEVVTSAWEVFKKAWEEISEHLAELEGCRDQVNNRPFESYVMKVDDSTFIGSLLTHATNITDIHDEICRLINNLILKQSKVIEKRRHYEKLNEFGLLFEPEADSIDVSHLLGYSDAQEMLVTGSYDRTDFEMFILSHMVIDNTFSRNSLRFDIHRIKRQILEQFTCGKCLLTTNHFRQAFNFKIEIQEGEDQPAATMQSFLTGDVVEAPTPIESNTGIYLLIKMAHTIRKGPYSVLLDEESESSFNVSQIKDDDELVKPAEFVAQLIAQIIQNDPECAKVGAIGRFAEIRLDAAAKELLHIELRNIPVLLRSVNYLSLNMIFGLAMLIVKKFVAKEYLFTHLSPQFSDLLDPHTGAQLTEFSRQLLKLRVKDEALRDWKNLLEKLKEVILSPEMLNAMLPRVQSPLIEVLKDEIEQLPFGNLPRDDLNKVLPPSVYVSQLRAYMRYLHILFGKILIRFTTHTEKPKKSAATPELPEQDLYYEKVPVEIQKEQIRLDTERVAAPGGNPLGEPGHEEGMEEGDEQKPAPNTTPAEPEKASPTSEVFVSDSIPSLLALQQQQHTPLYPNPAIPQWTTGHLNLAPNLVGSSLSPPGLSFSSWSAIVGQTLPTNPLLQQHRLSAPQTNTLNNNNLNNNNLNNNNLNNNNLNNNNLNNNNFNNNNFNTNNFNTNNNSRSGQIFQPPTYQPSMSPPSQAPLTFPPQPQSHSEHAPSASPLPHAQKPVPQLSQSQPLPSLHSPLVPRLPHPLSQSQTPQSLQSPQAPQSPQSPQAPQSPQSPQAPQSPQSPQSQSPSSRVASPGAPSPQPKAMQVIIRVVDEQKKQLLVVKEKRASSINVIFEKVTKKGRTGVVLVTGSAEVIEPSTTATLDKFLKDESTTELVLEIAPLSAVIRIETTYMGTKLILAAVPSFDLIALHDRIATHFELKSAEISLADNTTRGTLPRESIALGEWLARFEPTSLLELEVKLGGISIEYVAGNGPNTTVEEKPQTTVQRLYQNVATWRGIPINSFYLSMGGWLLDKDDLTPLGALEVDSKLKLTIVEASQVAKIRVTRNGLSDAVFGFALEVPFENMWAQVESSLPDMVMFPPNCHVISLHTSHSTVAKLWEACRMSEADFVVDALPKSDTVQVRLQIGFSETVLVSKPDVLIGDIFETSIPRDSLKEFTLKGHDGSEEITDADWTTTIGEYAKLMQALMQQEIEIIQFSANKPASKGQTFQVLINERVHTLVLPSDCTVPTVLACVKEKFPELPIDYICNSEGVTITDAESLQAVIHENAILRTASQQDVHTVIIQGTQFTIGHTTTAQDLSTHLRRLHLLDPETESLAIPSGIALDAKLYIPKVENLAVEKWEHMLCKQVEYKGKVTKLTTRPDTTVNNVLEYAHILYNIPKNQSIGLKEKESEIEVGDEFAMNETDVDEFVIE